MNSIIYFFNKLFGIDAGQKSISYTSKQVWYGRVNDWKNLKATEKDIKLCMKRGVRGYMIELAGDLPNSGAKKAWTDDWFSEISAKYKKLVKMTRAAGLWLFVSIVNDNMGQGKYGDTSPKLEKVLPMAQSLALMVKKNGADGVIVQPVAETQTNGGRIFEKYCGGELYNFYLVYNGEGGFPKSPGGFQFRAVHPSGTKVKCPGDAFAISDHSALIRQLARGGAMDGVANAGKVAEWAETVFKNSNCRVLGYYAFLRSQHDKETINILGDLAKQYS